MADEPTGALDTENGIQVTKLLKELSKDRLVIVVTHNTELAKDYSDRIIHLLDGEVKTDEQVIVSKKPLTFVEKKTKEKTYMGFFTAFKLSFLLFYGYLQQ